MSPKPWWALPDEKAAERIHELMDRLRIKATDAGGDTFDIRLADRHTLETARRAGRGDWQRAVVSALAQGLKFVEEMQSDEARAAPVVDGPASGRAGPDQVRVQVTNPHALAGIDRLAAKAGATR